MPLSNPAKRELLHTREITCKGYRREDGLWDIEGHMTDVKSYAFDNSWRGTVEPGMPIHGMWLRLTMDTDMIIHAVEAVTDQAPFDICPAITPNFQRLVGLRVGLGFKAKVKERLGGIEGCTHLVELLAPLATTAFQTIYSTQAREQNKASADEGAPRRRPGHLNTCHALRVDGDVVKKVWPEFHISAEDFAEERRQSSKKTG